MPEKKWYEHIPMVGEAAGAIIGLLGGGGPDYEGQYAQEEKLQALHIRGSKEMLDYSKNRDYEMWNKTGIWNQAHLMKQAGINPALLYGMGGAGGQTTGGGSAGTGGGHGAAVGQNGMGLMLDKALTMAQIAQMKAQTENIEADTKKKEVEVPNIQTQTQSLAQGIKNQQASEQLTQVQTRLGQIEEKFGNASLNDRIQAVYYNARQGLETLNSLYYQNQVDKATVDEKISILEWQALQAQVQVALTEMNIKKTEAEIEEIVNKIAQGWEALEQGDTANAIKQYSAEVGELGAVGGLVANGVGKLFELFKIPGVQKIFKKGKAPIGFKTGGTEAKGGAGFKVGGR